MAGELDLFKRFLYEAPEDDPPPDIDVSDDAAVDGPPPDLPDDDTGGVDDAPPDLGDDGGMGDDFGGDDGGDFGDDTGEDGDQNPNDIMNLPEKISAIMNMNLYQRFLALLNNISSQLAQMKDNSDMLYTISPESIKLVPQLKKLEENIHLYLKNSFIHEDYSSNLLFFNKCLNLLALLNDFFDKEVNKGIRKADM